MSNGGLLLVYENARRGRPSLGGAQVSLATSLPNALGRVSIVKRLYQYIVCVCGALLVSPGWKQVKKVY
jgi:hypothetical protein